jgi:hypothetical protein
MSKYGEYNGKTNRAEVIRQPFARATVDTARVPIPPKLVQYKENASMAFSVHVSSTKKSPLCLTFPQSIEQSNGSRVKKFITAVPKFNPTTAPTRVPQVDRTVYSNKHKRRNRKVRGAKIL